MPTTVRATLAILIGVALAGCPQHAEPPVPPPPATPAPAPARPAPPPPPPAAPAKAPAAPAKVPAAPRPAPAEPRLAERPPAPPAAPPRPAPPPPPVPPAPTGEPAQGFGSAPRGRADRRVIVVRDPSTEAVRRAFHEASLGDAVLRLEVREPIVLTRMLPHLTGPRVTIEGNGATIDGSALAQQVALIDVRTHDVIVRDLRLRNGYDNLRIQGPAAHDIVVSHVSSTGARDDGISIGYGAHDVTVQWTFVAGNTRSVFCKRASNVSLHHSWIQKGWIRNPLFEGPGVADVRNVIVEDWSEWGMRFENGASGNVVASLFSLSPAAVAAGGKGDSALRFKNAGAVHAAGNTFRGAAVPATGTAASPRPAPAVRTLPVAEMEPVVRARAGCLPRDGVDERYLSLGAGWRVGRETPLRVEAAR